MAANGLEDVVKDLIEEVQQTNVEKAKVEAERDEYLRRVKCMICMHNERNVVLTNCSHVSFCVVCIERHMTM